MRLWKKRPPRRPGESVEIRAAFVATRHEHACCPGGPAVATFCVDFWGDYRIFSVFGRIFCADSLSFVDVI